MAKRTSKVALQVEYSDAENFRRTSKVMLNVEYSENTNFRRTSKIMLMVEYSGTPSTLGFMPTWQMMG